MKRFLYLFFIIFYCLEIKASTAHSEATDANVYGHVIDKQTGVHLSYINVYLKGTTIGVMTDATGHYFLKNIPEGEYVLGVKSLGYETVEKGISVRKGETCELNFEIGKEQISLDEVVISANRNVTTRRMAPALVKVLDQKILSTVNAACIADGLSFQPGVRVEDDCQNCGYQQVRINGLDGHYSQILIDSRPVFSALSGVYGLEQIPANMIERIEIVRGGGSALFGSSAIGGTINIITREPSHNSAQASHTSTAIGGSGAWDHNTMLGASLVTDNGKTGIYVCGQHRQRDGYDHDGDGFTEIPQLHNFMLGARAFYKTSLYSKLTFEYHGIHEKRRGGDALRLPPHEALIAEQAEHYVNGGGLGYDFYTPDYKNRLNVYVSVQNTQRRTYYGTGKDPNAYGLTHDLTLVGGMQYTHNFDKLLFMPAEMTAGAEYSYDALSDDISGYNRHIDQKVHIGSLYFQNEWKDERWGFLIGARLDKHNLIRRLVFSPRINVRYNPTKDINLRISYSEGFRAPQAFDEDLHIAAVGGTVSIIEIDSDLREEKSRSVSLSADVYQRIGTVQTNFLLEGFYTDLSHQFVVENTGFNSDGYLIRCRRNGSGAYVYGVNLEAKAAFASWIETQVGITWQRSFYKEAEQWSEDEAVAPVKQIFRTPDWYGYFLCNTKPLKRLHVDVSGTYTGRMTVQHLQGSGTDMDVAVRTPSFFNANVKLSYDFELSPEMVLQLQAGVSNVFNAYQQDFDQGEDRDSGYIYGPSTPRSYFFGCKLSFR